MQRPPASFVPPGGTGRIDDMERNENAHDHRNAPLSKFSWSSITTEVLGCGHTPLKQYAIKRMPRWNLVSIAGDVRRWRCWIDSNGYSDGNWNVSLQPVVDKIQLITPKPPRRMLDGSIRGNWRLLKCEKSDGLSKQTRTWHRECDVPEEFDALSES